MTDVIESGSPRPGCGGLCRSLRSLPRLAPLALLLVGLGGCSFDMDGFAFGNDKSVTAHVGTSEPLLGPDGRCTADVNVSPSALGQSRPGVEIGMTECELVRLKGQPNDVLVGESGKGQREVQVLYQEPTGKKLFMFTDNKLTRVVE
ncbi:hypothetical protein [Chelatococcus reniformis]|uniref:Uncharacterized protein n=1 Tax=Chelatococcus reniformis TaxID=1494448 RepID=A0A916UD73_9HYPH|nr:hypothetical protein [Chelatococcus reniformis]GGC69168.1 hypothetical protein GCM10010994_29620 [Chelatococcus reniformis]